MCKLHYSTTERGFKGNRAICLRLHGLFIRKGIDSLIPMQYIVINERSEGNELFNPTDGHGTGAR